MLTILIMCCAAAFAKNQFQDLILAGQAVGANSQAAKMTQDPNSASNREILTATLRLPAGNNTVTITTTNLNGDYGTSNYSLTVAGGQGITFAHELNGNLTNAVTATATNEYDWDAENRLVELTQWTASEFINDAENGLLHARANVTVPAQSDRRR